MFSSSFPITLPNIKKYFPGIHFPGIHLPANKRSLKVAFISFVVHVVPAGEAWTWHGGNCEPHFTRLGSSLCDPVFLVKNTINTTSFSKALGNSLR